MGDLCHMRMVITLGRISAKISCSAFLSLASVLVFTVAVWPLVPVSAWAAGPANKHSFAFNIESGHVTISTRTVRVKEGDFVEISWKADSDIELHLHGYDLLLRLKPGELRKLSFQAHTTGRYPVSAHGSGGHGALIYIEIHPH